MTGTMDILNGIPHAIALLDLQSRITAMNTVLESISGYCTEDVRGISVAQVIRTNFSVGEIQSVVDSGESFSGEGNMIDMNRKKVSIRLTVSPLKGGSGNPEGMVLVLEEVSGECNLNGRDLEERLTFSFIGHSPQMREIYELLPVLTQTDATVLITGETGTGKDLLAETIHLGSRRAGYPFIKVNCGAIPEALIESELFGHKRGAFTGAHGDKPGMFQLAQGGTIYLTEIGDLPLQLQVKLLTVLDDREFFPLGSSRKIQVDVRIITGTHHNLKKLVQEGKFREDLFFRLNVLRAHLPPLRDRGDDIMMLLEHFQKKIGANLKKDISGFTRAARSLLSGYHYGGNVRELRNIVEYAVNICQENRIDLHHLPAYILKPEKKETSDFGFSQDELTAKSLRLSRKTSELPESLSSWTEIEKLKILNALLNNDGNRTLASRELGWGRSTLWRKIKEYGLK